MWSWSVATSRLTVSILGAKSICPRMSRIGANKKMTEARWFHSRSFALFAGKTPETLSGAHGVLERSDVSIDRLDLGGEKYLPANGANRRE